MSASLHKREERKKRKLEYVSIQPFQPFLFCYSFFFFFFFQTKPFFSVAKSGKFHLDLEITGQKWTFRDGRRLGWRQ
jgi:hypothetical protein